MGGARDPPGGGRSRVSIKNGAGGTDTGHRAQLRTWATICVGCSQPFPGDTCLLLGLKK